MVTLKKKKSIIPEKKFLIITGEPRSGTSLMMQTLKLLDVPVAGKEFPEGIPIGKRMREADRESRSERQKKLNPKGFYELRGVVMRGVRNIERHMKLSGKAVKIISSGIPKRKVGEKSSGTDKDLVWKMILCLRNPINISVSQKGLGSNLKVNIDKKWESSAKIHPISPTRTIRGLGSLVSWFYKNPEMLEKTLSVDYDSFVDNPKKVIGEIVEFLEIKKNKRKIEKAIKNVDIKLRRSAKPIEWPDHQKENGKFAIKIYESLKSKNPKSVIEELFKRGNKQFLELARWVDDDDEFGTWFLITASLYRSLKKNNRGVYDKMLQNRAAREAAFMIPTCCTHFQRGGEEYTVKRPEDIGDLTRNKVICSVEKDEKTLEKCMVCWNKLIQ